MNRLLFLLLITVLTGISTLMLTAQPDFCDDAVTYYELDEALKEPEKVVKLDIAMQKLTMISADISKLVNLECLDLSFNRISGLPAEFALLKKLRYLNLTGTRYLSALPKVLTELPELEIVDIRDHPEWKAVKFEEAKKMLPDVKVITDK